MSGDSVSESALWMSWRLHQIAECLLVWCMLTSHSRILRKLTSIRQPFRSMSHFSLSPEVEPYVQSIYARDQTKFSVWVTGGGAQVIPWLFTVPGASACLIEASVPYSYAALSDVLGSLPTQCCSAETAELIAEAALKRNVKFILNEQMSFQYLIEKNIFGVSCTAALVSQTPKKGSHRCFVGTASAKEISVVSIELNKGARDRVGEDYVCSRIILDEILKLCEVAPSRSDYLLSGSNGSSPTESVVCEYKKPKNSLQDLLNNSIKMSLVIPNAKITTRDQSDQNFLFLGDVELPRGTVVFPGSFNPVHEGHISLAAMALQNETTETERPLLVFELSVFNADKPPLSESEILRRLEVFREQQHIFSKYNIHDYAIVLTTEPYFFKKSIIFKGCKFVIGTDTMIRLLNPVYYNNSAENMISSLSSMSDRNCSFIVGGRLQQNRRHDTSESRFISCDDAMSDITQHTKLSDVVIQMFHGIAFRFDLSSTMLRKQLEDLQNSKT